MRLVNILLYPHSTHLLRDAVCRREDVGAVDERAAAELPVLVDQHRLEAFRVSTMGCP